MENILIEFTILFKSLLLGPFSTNNAIIFIKQIYTRIRIPLIVKSRGISFGNLSLT
jgi:hypothetical protein